MKFVMINIYYVINYMQSVLKSRSLSVTLEGDSWVLFINSS